MTSVYRKRENFLLKGESEGRIEPDALVWLRPDGTVQSLRWAEVRSIRLRSNPAMGKRWRHQTRIDTAASSIAIDNGHFAGISDFEDRSRDYSPFVRAALERIQACAPQASVEIGSPPLVFFGLMAFAIAGLAALVFVLIALPLPAPFPLVVIAKLGIVAYLLTMMPRWIRTNWPRKGDFKSAAGALP